MATIAILGYGTVGSGVLEVLRRNAASIERRAGQPVTVKYICDIRDFSSHPDAALFVNNIDVILSDPEVTAVVETIGGLKPAYFYVKSALESGRHVVTSNKELVATHGAELLAIARRRGVCFLFEASVGGGIPILRPLHSSLTGDVIEEITGILNGTTNYMMTKMFYEGADYDEVLKEAQDNGFAERNPEADVEGYDACRKIAILSSIISGKQVDFEDIYCEGITKITVEDMKYAKAMGMTIKLLATCKRDGEKLNAMVAPCLLRAEHPLFAINGVFNSIFVHGNMLGDAMFYGSGAGKLPTASAVVGDIVEEARNLDRNLGVMWSSEKLALEDRRDVERRFFVRMKGSREELQDRVASVFGMVQFVQAEGVSGEFGFVTEKMPEGSYEEKAEQFGGQILGMIRVEE